jgi:hypothetical protein
VREVGYSPLHDREYELVRSRFASRRTGSMYAEGHGSMTLGERLALHAP